MEFILHDEEIENLLKETKVVPLEFDDFFKKWKLKKGHSEFDCIIKKSDGSYFTIKLRQNQENHLEFSAILTFTPKDINRAFRLTRYNGKSHIHRNKLEKEEAFYDFHIHKATERYQLAGRKEEHFAEMTSRYSSLRGAFGCLVEDCNVILKQNPQMHLF